MKNPIRFLAMAAIIWLIEYPFPVWAADRQEIHYTCASGKDFLAISYHDESNENKHASNSWAINSDLIFCKNDTCEGMSVLRECRGLHSGLDLVVEISGAPYNPNINGTCGAQYYASLKIYDKKTGAVYFDQKLDPEECAAEGSRIENVLVHMRYRTISTDTVTHDFQTRKLDDKSMTEKGYEQ